MQDGTDATEFDIELPFPPSMNHYWRHVMRHGKPQVLVSAEGRRYREAVQAIVGGRAAPLSGRLVVKIDAWMPNRLRRDIDNLLKALLDACTHAGLWGDDSQIHNLAIINRGLDRPNGRVVVRARQLEKLLF